MDTSVNKKIVSIIGAIGLIDMLRAEISLGDAVNRVFNAYEITGMSPRRRLTTVNALSAYYYAFYYTGDHKQTNETKAKLLQLKEQLKETSFMNNFFSEANKKPKEIFRKQAKEKVLENKNSKMDLIEAILKSSSVNESAKINALRAIIE